MIKLAYPTAALLLLLAATINPAQADITDHYLVTGLSDYVSAPLRWDGGDWLTFGAISGGILLTAEYLDDRWKQDMVSENHPSYNRDVARIGNQWGDLRLSGPVMLGVYGYGYWSDNSTYLNASYNMAQAAAYTGVMTTALKMVFRRDRPSESVDESGWFKGGSAFPSGHTSLAFAVSRAYLNSLDTPSIPTQVLFYGLATSTAFARTYDNKHWASDVVAGALLGIYTADFVRDNNNSRNKNKNSDVSYVPYIWKNQIGLQVSWR